jgi:rubrerythrin
MSNSLRMLRDDSGLDQTLQNLLKALSLNLELRARYRVFEFEAAQDGYPEIARMFRGLRESEIEHVSVLITSLQSRLGAFDALPLGD